MSLKNPSSQIFFPRNVSREKPNNLDQERIHIHDHPRLGIEDQNAVFGRLEEPAIADLRSDERRFRPLSLVRVGRNERAHLRAVSTVGSGDASGRFALHD